MPRKIYGSSRRFLNQSHAGEPGVHGRGRGRGSHPGRPGHPGRSGVPGGIQLAQALGAASGQAVPSVAVPNALVLLSSTTLAGVGVFDVSGIDQTYNDLVCVAIVRSTVATVSDFVTLNLNADAGANYNVQFFYGEAATPVTSNGLASSSARLVEAATGASGTASRFTVIEFEICGYTSTAFQKIIKVHAVSASADSAAQSWTESNMALWKSTAAVNRIQISANGSNLAIGSQLRIYGRL